MAKRSIPHLVYAAVVLIIALVAIGAFVYVNQKNINSKRIEQDSEQDKRASNQLLLDACLSTAEENHQATWDSETKRLGSRDGTLPDDVAEYLNRLYKEAKEDCFRKYPVQ